MPAPPPPPTSISAAEPVSVPIKCGPLLSSQSVVLQLCAPLTSPTPAKLDNFVVLPKAHRLDCIRYLSKQFKVNTQYHEYLKIF